MATFTYNGRRFDELMILKGFSIPAWATVRLEHNIIPNRNGALVSSRRHMSRMISVPVAFKFRDRKDFNEIMERISSHLLALTAKPLIFDLEPERQFFAKVDERFTVAPGNGVAEGSISFICHDPYKYAVDPVVTNATAIQNRGSAPCHPNFLVQFTASRNEFVITNATTGRTQRVLWNFAAGDVLEIDSAKRRISINGRAQMHAFDFMSQWIELAPGINNLQANHGFMTDFFERWY
ncbi:MAG: phage tail family protein [Turicibacter sp.]|nr:phage tail family protein [Turicibacter sp.]